MVSNPNFYLALIDLNDRGNRNGNLGKLLENHFHTINSPGYLEYVCRK